MEEQLRRDAMEYHRVPTSGKISVTPTKSLMNQRDLALAYSPGVAYACLAIRDDPNEAATQGGKARPGSRTEQLTALLKSPTVLSVSGRTIEFDGQGKCVAGCS